MSEIWDRAIALSEEFTKLFEQDGTLDSQSNHEEYPWWDRVYSSAKYRRAHINIVDARETNKIWMMHVCVFPHANDPSPIYGFDIICGENKITGAFLDYSLSGDPTSPMYLWFKARVNELTWKKPRELPDWAEEIFSPAMVAAGNINDTAELEQLCEIAQATLYFYLKNVGLEQQDVADYHMAQNRYCRNQKLNPHNPKAMQALGLTAEQAKAFVDNIMFPEIV